MWRGARSGARREQGAPGRFRPLEGGQAGRALLAQPLGAWSSRLAHRVLRHGGQVPGRNPGHPRRRRRPRLPPSRERDRPERGLHRLRALRSLLAAQWLAVPRRREDEQVPGKHHPHHRGPGEIRCRWLPPVRPQFPLSQPPHLQRGGAGRWQASRRAPSPGRPPARRRKGAAPRP